MRRIIEILLISSVLCVGVVGCDLQMPSQQQLREARQEVQTLEEALDSARADEEYAQELVDRQAERLKVVRDALEEKQDQLTDEQAERAAAEIAAAEATLDNLAADVVDAKRETSALKARRDARALVVQGLETKAVADAAAASIKDQGVEGIWRIIGPYLPIQVQVVGGIVGAIATMLGAKKVQKVVGERDDARADAATTRENARRVIKSVDKASVTSPDGAARVTNKAKQRAVLGPDLSNWVEDLKN